MVRLPDARLPDGVRRYVIGDVHGHLGALETVEARVTADMAAHGAADCRMRLLGDYVDRGPDSAGVLRWLAERCAAGIADGIVGNHDAYLRTFLADPDTDSWPSWFANGAEATLASFGIEPPDPWRGPGPARRREIRDRIAEALGADGVALLDSLPTMRREGDYAFVHGGVRPGVALDAQDPHDLVWIREPFLGSDADFGAVVVHGHTPSAEVTVRPNRIGIDTGVAYGGQLTGLVLAGRERWLREADGRRRLPEPAAGTRPLSSV